MSILLHILLVKLLTILFFCSLCCINSLDGTFVKHEQWTVFGIGLWVLVYYTMCRYSYLLYITTTYLIVFITIRILLLSQQCVNTFVD